ncbi:hypothetical protein EDD74_11187 [Faecalimonas umbilicata]|uniref:DUF3592 domain-containing protein n=2 Tax=Faecalimonas umbilicata TaxID=1912855 RepID=A0A4V6NYN9_9FIRM|nr:hypothetical protein EDD74_11187 [Faecalimonas umbilicata]
MFLGTIIWVILCGSVFLMGGILFTFAVFKLIHSTLYIGEVYDIEVVGRAKVAEVVFHLITEHEGKKIKVEPLNRLAIFLFFEKTQLKRFKRKYMGKQMKIYISTDGASYLKRFLPRYFFMSIFLMALGIFVFLVPYISS